MGWNHQLDLHQVWLPQTGWHFMISCERKAGALVGWYLDVDALLQEVRFAAIYVIIIHHMIFTVYMYTKYSCIVTHHYIHRYVYIYMHITNIVQTNIYIYIYINNCIYIYICTMYTIYHTVYLKKQHIVPTQITHIPICLKTLRHDRKRFKSWRQMDWASVLEAGKKPRRRKPFWDDGWLTTGIPTRWLVKDPGGKPHLKNHPFTRLKLTYIISKKGSGLPSC